MYTKEIIMLISWPVGVVFIYWVIIFSLKKFEKVWRVSEDEE